MNSHMCILYCYSHDNTFEIQDSIYVTIYTQGRTCIYVPDILNRT